MAYKQEYSQLRMVSQQENELHPRIQRGVGLRGALWIVCILQVLCVCGVIGIFLNQVYIKNRLELLENESELPGTKHQDLPQSRITRNSPGHVTAHLLGDGTSINPYKDPGTGEEIFMWKNPNDATESIGHLTNLSYLNRYDSNNEGLAGKLKIFVSGYYFVYAKITCAGILERGQRLTDPHCGYEIIRQRKDTNQRTTLMRSFLVQFERGKPLKSCDDQDCEYPQDSSYQGGVFHLSVGDLIYVKPDQQHYYKRRFNMQPEQSFFGAFLISRHH